MEDCDPCGNSSTKEQEWPRLHEFEGGLMVVRTETKSLKQKEALLENGRRFIRVNGNVDE